VQLGATTDLFIRAGHWRFDVPVLPRQLLRGAINDEAHVIKPQAGTAETALTANHGWARLDVIETEI
jgi:hypothetical protein